MKLVFATPLYPPEIGGPATYIKELAERMRDRHNITIVAYASTWEKIAGTKLITISKRQPLPIRLLKYTVVLYRASKGMDVIYAQQAVASGLPAVIVGKLRNIPVVIKFVGDEAWERATQLRLTTKPLEVFMENPEGTLKIHLLMKLQGFVLRRAKKITPPSKYLGEAIAKTYRIPKDKILTNYNAAEKKEVIPFESSVIPHQIITTARLVEWKGIDGIIRATALLTKKFPDVKLLIGGDGPEEDNLKKLSQDLGIEKHVVFLGRVPRAETWHLRKTSEVYVLNSTYEGLPHTALTSFAAEIPMVATDISGTNEAVYDEVSGLLVESDNDTELAEAITRLFEDKELRKKIVEGGNKILYEKFSWKVHIETLEKLFQSI